MAFTLYSPEFQSAAGPLLIDVVLVAILDANSFTDIIHTNSSVRYTAANMFT